MAWQRFVRVLSGRIQAVTLIQSCLMKRHPTVICWLPRRLCAPRGSGEGDQNRDEAEGLHRGACGHGLVVAVLAAFRAREEARISCRSAWCVASQQEERAGGPR